MRGWNGEVWRGSGPNTPRIRCVCVCVCVCVRARAPYISLRLVWYESVVCRRFKPLCLLASFLSPHPPPKTSKPDFVVLYRLRLVSQTLGSMLKLCSSKLGRRLGLVVDFVVAGKDLVVVG